MSRYAYPFDPVNMNDLNGEWWHWVKTVAHAVASAAEKAIVWTLMHFADKIIDGIAGACGPAYLICKVVGSGIGEFVWDLFDHVYLKGEHTRDALPGAVNAAILAMAESAIPIPEGVRWRTLNRVLGAFESRTRVIIDFVINNGHSIVGNALLQGFNTIENWLFNRMYS